MHGVDPTKYGVAKVIVRKIIDWLHRDHTLYRGDARSPEELAAASGFLPPYTNRPEWASKYPNGVTPDIAQHADGQTNAFVSTSTDRKTAEDFALGRYLYEITAPGGIYSDATLYPSTGKKDRGESEVLFPGGIDWKYVKGWYKMTYDPGDRKFVRGPFVPNPDYLYRDRNTSTTDTSTATQSPPKPNPRIDGPHAPPQLHDGPDRNYGPNTPPRQESRPIREGSLGDRIGHLADPTLESLRPHLRSTPGGMSAFAPGAASPFVNEKSAHNNDVYTAGRVQGIPGQFLVDMHGSADAMRVGNTPLSPRQVADLIRANPDYDGGPVTVLGCGTGSTRDGFAAQLSRELGTKVTAPTGDSWVDHTGNMFASSREHGADPSKPAKPTWPPNGEWHTFSPDGDQTVHKGPYPPGHTPSWGTNTPTRAPQQAAHRGEDTTQDHRPRPERRHVPPVPDSGFHGHGVPEASNAHAQRLADQGRAAVERIAGGFDHTRVERLADGSHRVTDPHGSYTVDVRSAPLPERMVARTTADHEGGRHLVELSRNMDSRHVDRAVANELGTIAYERKLHANGETPPAHDALRPGTPEPGTRPSSRDAGRAQELRVLAEQYSKLTPADAISLARVRREGLALVDHLGLRDDTAGAPERRGLVDQLLTESGRSDVRAFLADVGRPEHDLPPGDRHHDSPNSERSDTEQRAEADLSNPPADAAPGIERFTADLKRNAEIEAAQRGTTPKDEIQQFIIGRALARFFADNPDGWVLKGGQALRARYPGSRSSTDLDFTRTTTADPESMVRDYERALARDLGDHLTFVRGATKSLLNGTGVRLSHTVYLGVDPMMDLSVDLAPPRPRPDPSGAGPVWREPDVVPFPDRALSTGAEGATPNLRVISLEETLAHKVSGMYTHGSRTLETKCDECVLISRDKFTCRSGAPPIRSQDLADVLMLATNSPWDARETHAELRREFAWRIDQQEALQVPKRFEVPNPDWARSFAEYAKTLPALAHKSLKEAEMLAGRFLDPLLSDNPPDARWDHREWRWVDKSELDGQQFDTPDTERGGSPEQVQDSGEQPRVRQAQLLERTGDAPPSDALADPAMVERWDALADRRSPDSYDAFVDRLKEGDLGTSEKLRAVRDFMAEVGETPSPVTGLDSKNLRVYTHQRGELYIHSAALMADRGTTLEIAYEFNRTIGTYRWEAHQSHVAHLGPVPDGIEANDANAAAYWRQSNGLPRTDSSADTVTRDLVDMQAQPLRDAIKMRQRLIDDHGIDPSRIRLVHDDGKDKGVYGDSRWVRAHLLTLDAIRDNPEQARQDMLDAMRGSGERGEHRERRAQDVVDRLEAATPPRDGQGERTRQKYALLWVRDSRDQPVGSRHGPHLDTRPEMLRQTIEALRESHPDVRPVLLGDDVFARRPELLDQWRRDGVLDGVDADTLVGYWDADRNGGQPLSHAEQALFFHRLTEQHDVVQIGMESGAMELPAVLGTPTVYLEAKEHDGNKGNRWALYWQEWAYGSHEAAVDSRGAQLYDSSGRPIITRFAETEARSAPLSSIERVLYGRDLDDPSNRRAQPIAVYESARVAVTADRIVRLVDSGELGSWSQRLGRTAGLTGAEWQTWSDQQWAESEFYVDQLHRWLSAEADTSEGMTRKWDGIRLALNGVVDPGFTADRQIEKSDILFAYAGFRNDQPLPADQADRIRQAFAAAPEERAAAVTQVLTDLLSDPGFRRQAVDDMRVFAFDPAEIQNLREAIDRVVRRSE
ncbi:hypothetical protein V5P93_003698 [Actinokineospora auranticolor]|uniref:Pierisin-like domain-containing protein n=1 Tax=Actinokineospora auranticolor TaxID=155976 RepID=A0A2S6GJ88_9PSEU|nr:nucleotidyl transferase AbiEii/AbiGii toxin family protein [Actinokineospora auranticolor]PPK65260.1 hypothetical protein CLV40_115107 [Actinokineospora auranticolor]